MTETLERLETWMQAKENEHLEFKEAKNHFDFDELVKYCVALANEGGGQIVLGVTDKPPRQVVGSRAFANLERTKSGLIERLHLRIEMDEVNHPDGPVVIVHVPPHPIGVPIAFEGAYWMRAGDSLAPMTADMLRRIFDEARPDFSAEVCRGATMADLDTGAIGVFRRTWHRRSGNPNLLSLSDEQLLTDAELIVDGALTYAALILFGARQALGKHLAQAEVVFEYRSNGASGPPQQRVEYRQGFFSFHDDLWEKMNLRNEVQHFQQGLFMLAVPTFSEVVIREAILNAVSHRDYRLSGSVFVRQFARKIEIVSPGGFPPGITVENILTRQSPRNRRIAEAFAKCGLVERSGQGMNRMFEECIKESKPKPDFADSDAYQVAVQLRGDIQDVQFLRFIEQIGLERLATFNTDDFLALDMIHNEQPVSESLKARLPGLVDRGVIELLGRGRGTRYILSRRFYDFMGKKGVYTRKRGLDRETNKELLLKHINDHQSEGSQFQDLWQVLPSLTRNQVQSLLRELKAAGRVESIGHAKAARWYVPSRAH